MLRSGIRAQGVLEQPAVVSKPFEVIEHRLVHVARGNHAAGGDAAMLAVTSRPASSRYCSAMAGHSSCGAVALAAALLNLLRPSLVLVAVALAAAERSMVLLKDQGDILPLSPSTPSLAVIGSEDAAADRREPLR